MATEKEAPEEQLTAPARVYELRSGREADHAFVYATWLRSYKHSSAFARRIADRTFYEYHHQAIQRILARGATLTVAHAAGSPEVILGYSCREGCILHFAYVKKPFRRLGIGSALLGEPQIFTHATNDWQYLHKKCPMAQYNPYLI